MKFDFSLGVATPKSVSNDRQKPKHPREVQWRAMPAEEKDSAASADENLAKKNVSYKKLKNSC